MNDNVAESVHGLVSLNILKALALQTQRNQIVEMDISRNTDGDAMRDFWAYKESFKDPEDRFLLHLYGEYGLPAEDYDNPLQLLTRATLYSGTVDPRALDIGCGIGRFVSDANTITDISWFGLDKTFYAHWLLSSNPESVGNDDEMFELWRRQYPHAPANHFFLQDMHDMKTVPDNAFNLAISGSAMTYTLETKVIEEIDRILAPGGMALFQLLKSDPSTDDVYAANKITREEAFSHLKAKGHHLSSVDSELYTMGFYRKGCAEPLRFPSELTSPKMMKRFVQQYQA